MHINVYNQNRKWKHVPETKKQNNVLLAYNEWTCKGFLMDAACVQPSDHTHRVIHYVKRTRDALNYTEQPAVK